MKTFFFFRYRTCEKCKIMMSSNDVRVYFKILLRCILEYENSYVFRFKRVLDVCLKGLVCIWTPKIHVYGSYTDPIIILISPCPSDFKFQYHASLITNKALIQISSRSDVNSDNFKFLQLIIKVCGQCPIFTHCMTKKYLKLKR